LIRRISPYSGPDILLGVFDSELFAQKARDSYFEKYSPVDQQSLLTGWLATIFPWLRSKSKINLNGDQWYKQAYKADGLVKDDLIIQYFEAEGDVTSSEISIVSCYYDSMGQIMREIDSIHSNRYIAEHRMLEIQKISENSDPPDYKLPNTFNTQTIQINLLQSDSPENQPIR